MHSTFVTDAERFDEEQYGETWFELRKRYHEPTERVAQALTELCGPFESVVDMGTGDGWFVHALGGGVGVEINETAMQYMPDDVEGVIHDLRDPLDLGRTFDVVLCIEVAEHLPHWAADILCDTCVRHTGQLLVFSAAEPGQRGHGHVNCQPASYWIWRLERRGMKLRRDMTDALRKAWRDALGQQMPWLPRNIMLFTKAGEVTRGKEG